MRLTKTLVFRAAIKHLYQSFQAFSSITLFEGASSMPCQPVRRKKQFGSLGRVQVDICSIPQLIACKNRVQGISSFSAKSEHIND